MADVASYKASASLRTDRRINLIYGLNGTGKSTLSNFLYDPTDPAFSNCRIDPDRADPILVYNQRFIHDNFFVADALRGVFSLSKENKAATEKITQAESALTQLSQQLQEAHQAQAEEKAHLDRQKKSAINTTWQIKTDYSGGDRVLEYCLEGLRGQKDRLFSYLMSVDKPNSEPRRDVAVLKEEVASIGGDGATTYPELRPLTLGAHDVESHALLEKAILGNDGSEVAALIESLKNADWVRRGLRYLPEETGEVGQPCPFCQENTITSVLVDKLERYFDEAYQSDVSTLQNLKNIYNEARNGLPSLSIYTDHPLAEGSELALREKYGRCTNTLDANLKALDDKLANPSSRIKLRTSRDHLDAFNQEVAALNKAVVEHNAKIANKEAALASLKDEFWSIMRWQFDQTISRYDADCESSNARLAELGRKIQKVESEIKAQTNTIAGAQKETVNVKQAVDAINARLLDLGIDEFHVAKHSDSLYRVARAGELGDAFHTLSEGEKMIISFLYFCELCLGRSSADDTAPQKIAVIDDPVSSLSHVFVFNVGQLIRSVFFSSGRFSQVFVLTHSLYFFYELADANHERRKKSQSLFRMSKSTSGSKIQEMKYEEVQNDYQAYWSIINDPDQQPALIANCMRNIVEYFFSFVRRKDLNNVFQMPQLQDVRFQAFCRFVNRESHSSSLNIMDMKEFDYEDFKEGLRLVFDATGYAEHFNEMAGRG